MRVEKSVELCRHHENTHVLVNDPTTGYGIFIENTPNAAA